MTNFTLPRKQLQKIINLCNQISVKRSEVEIFTFTKIILLPQSVELSVASGIIYYRAELPAENIETTEETSFLVKTETLASIVALMTDEKLHFELDTKKGNLVIKGSRSKHNLRINTDIEQFNLPQMEEENMQVRMTVKAADLILANRFGLISVGLPKNIYQPEFLNVCYSFVDDVVFAVSTDRFRIIKHKIPTENIELNAEVEQPKNFLFLPKNLQILNSAIEESDVKVTLESGLAFFEFDSQTLICRYGDGKYPDYNKIIPQSFACNFVLNVKDTLDALRQVYFFAKVNIINKNINIEVKPEISQIKFGATTDDGNSSESTLTFQNYEGQSESWTQAFNADYLLEYISSLSCESFLWESNPNKPSVLSPLDNKENQLYLVSGLK